MTSQSKIFKLPEIRIQLGATLKNERLQLGYSLGDLVDMTLFPKNTIINLEKGITTNIDYYIAYAQAIQLDIPTLFNVEIELKPRIELSEKKKARTHLSKKLRVLLTDEMIFDKETYVKDIIDRLVEKGDVIKTKKLSAEISGVLRNWANEDGILRKIKKEGGVNAYIKA